MAVKIFQQLREKALANKAMLPAERRAMFWFHDYSNALTDWQDKYHRMGYDTLVRKEFTKQVVGANYAQPGFFYFYLYDPKWKRELPYYDKFPFTLCLKAEQGRFLGLNFHYLDYYNRARLFDLLYQFREGRPPSKNEDRSEVRDIRMRLKVTYELLKMSSKYRAFRPCIKEYLVPHVRTPLLKVGAREWDIALFLPVEQFQKETATFVWRESAKHI